MHREPGGLVAAWYRGARWLWLLRPLEGLYRSIVWLRRRLYASGLLTSYRAPVPVVVVGNITVGGTGKSPIVIALVEALQARDIRVGVVSRGYGARPAGGAGSFPHVLNERTTAADCGDEALQLYRRTGCPCAVAPSRPAAVRALLQASPLDIVLSDDGLQHYALARDMEIAVVDAERGIGNGFCLPAGPLREPASRLRSVDQVLYRGSDDPHHGVFYRPQCLVNLRTAERRPVQPLAVAAQVHAVAGIGQPGQFFAALRRAGFRIEPHVFPDHHDYGAADFAQLQDRPILMTEKDAVKCVDLAGPNAWYLRIEARLPAALPRAVMALLQN
ncbi:MAG: tetraacyldisaccharide 4'-kinase [Halioglobus sp.]|nr:tetraacyldisaccharide 4'-kinase [Halioglobus sp.]